MNCTLQHNNSEPNKAKKKLDILSDVEITLKDPTEIVNPVLVLSDISVSNFNNCNYITIDDLKRSYFVTNKKRISRHIIEISCHCDVLSSFIDSIKDCYGIVERNERKYNLYLDDGQFKTYSNPTITTHLFPHGFSEHEFVLAVAGG